MNSSARAFLIVTFVCASASLTPGSSSALNQSAVSVWNELKLNSVGAFSWLNARPLEDCMRPEQVECFSIQQNLWVLDRTGTFALWLQNVVELARLQNESYFGTYGFEMWIPPTTRPPLVCEPKSDVENDCRSPFFSDRIVLPYSFNFYAHISDDGQPSIRMSNDFGSVDWSIPSSVECPCSIATVRHETPPWGYYPFEFVMVGLDSAGLALFRNNTNAILQSTLVQYSDGTWHDPVLMTLSCSSQACPTRPATSETSSNLLWNSTTGEISWSNGAADQGITISALSANESTAPLIRNPIPETFLYLKFKLGGAGYFIIHDQQRRALGFDASSSSWLLQIPNSSLSFTPGSEAVIMNPVGTYDVTVTSGSNMRFMLFASESTNTGGVFLTRTYNGSLNMGDSTKLLLNAYQLDIKSGETPFQTAIPIMLFIIGSTSWIFLVIAILFILRKRRRQEE